MEKENINISVTGDVKSPIEIILLEGRAKEHDLPIKYNQKGTIGSPVAYLGQIKDKSKAIVEFSVSERWIRILADPTDKYAGEVKGDLKINPDLVEFGINKEKTFTSSKLISLARSYAHCFKSTQEAQELIKSLQNFDVKFEQTYIKTDDRKGTKEDSLKSAIVFNKGEVKTQLTLFLPLFVGTEKVFFDVEIEIDAYDGKPVFSFYSIDMEKIIKEETERQISEQLEFLSEFTKIMVS